MTRSEKSDPSRDELKALQKKMQRLEDECRQLRGELETAQSEIATTPEFKTDQDAGSDNVVTLDTGDANWAAEEQLAGILEISADAIISIDSRGMIRLFNRGAEAIFGYTAREILGKPLEILLPKHFREGHRDHIARFAQSGESSRPMNSRGEIFGLRKNGGEFPAEASIAKSESGGRTSFTVILRDVSERKQAEFALHENESLLRSVVDNLPAPAHIKDPDGCYVLVNPEYERQFGYTDKEAKGRTTGELYPPQVADQALAQDRKVMESGKTVEYEFKMGEGGDARYFLTIKTPLLDPEGKLSAIVCVETDITRRKQTEAALAEREAQLRQTQQIARIGAFIWDDVGQDCIYCSDELAQLFGVSVDQFLDRWGTHEKFIGNVHADDREAVDQAVGAAVGGKTAYDIEFRCYDGEGRLLNIREIGEPVLDDTGNQVRTFGTMQDITALRHTQEALRQSMRATELLRRIATAANDSADAEDAMRICLREVCEYGDWPVGDIFVLADDGADALVPANIWYMDDAERYGEIRKRTEGVRYEAGTGLPGRVIASGEPAWIQDLRTDPRYPGERRLGEIGVRACFAFPVVIGHEVVAALECFAGEVREPDPHLLDVAAQAGIILGRVLERQRADQALRESEEQLRTITDNLPAFIAYADKDERYRFVNKTAENWYARPAAGIIGRTVREVVGVEAYTRLRQRIDTALSGETVNFEETRHFPDGGIRDSNLTYVPHFDEDGQVRGWFMLIQDITERKQAEAALREGEERFRTMMEYSPSAIFLKDLDGRYRLANKRCAEWIGVEIKDILGKTPRQFLGKQNFVDDYEAHDREVIEQNRSVQGVQKALFSDGTTHFLDTVKFPVYDSNARLMGIGGILTDVTEQRNAEEQLRQAQKMEAVGKLTGGVAHDFNNLLAVILGNTELLREKLGTENAALHAVMKASLRGAELTQRLLSFSRQRPLRPSAIGLPELIGNMATMLRRTLGEMIEIETRVPDSLWQAQADPGQLENAVLNLAINAQHAMQHGGRLIIEAANVTIDKKAANRVADAIPGAFVMLSMTDTGQGMSAAVLERAFEPFFTTKDVGEGSGLGLSMVYGFAQQSGGFVTIESVEGTGSCVRLHLPRAVDCKPAVPVKPAGARPDGHGESILVVEDDPDVRSLTVTMLKRLGYSVAAAEDGETALEMFEKNPGIDLLLSDVVLPGDLSGPDIADAARQRRPDLKVLFMSGYAEDVVRRQSSDSAHTRDAGDDLLPKPFSRGDLARKVRAALERGQAETG